MAEEKTAPKLETEHGDGQHEGTKTSGGVLSLQIPVDGAVWAEARRLAADKSARVDDLATVASQDPVIVIELLKTANAMFFSGGRPPITATKTAIQRLGSDVVIETMDALGKRPKIEDEDIGHWLELHRSRCRRTSIISRMISEVVIKNFSDECQVAGLLSFVGEMLAVAHFKEQYVKLADELSRSAIIYRLAQDFRFDVERMGINYLRRHGIPEVLLFALDREALSRSPERAQMKPTVMAAGEMVDAFDTNRWDKLAPGKTIPSKSNIRLLQMSDQQYLKLYERCSEYLFSARLLEEKKKQLQIQVTHSIEPASTPAAPSSNEPISTLDEEIRSLMSSAHREENVSVPPPAAPRAAPVAPPPRSNAPSVNEDAFGLKSADERRVQPPRMRPAAAKKVADAPRLANATSTKVVGEFANMFEEAANAEELLAKLLGMLVKPGLFEKSALIVVSRDRKNALVVAARGPNIGNGQTLIIDDPLSPLAECFSKVQSFGNRENKVSPFGSKAFALAPIDAPHDTPVALYADCGNDGSLTFESRRIFRTVVDILNQKLPYLPGSIPLEVGTPPGDA